jgi:hypothetical protein
VEIWKLLPPYFEDKRKLLKVESNALEAFIFSPNVSTDQTDTCPMGKAASLSALTPTRRHVPGGVQPLLSKQPVRDTALDRGLLSGHLPTIQHIDFTAANGTPHPSPLRMHSFGARAHRRRIPWDPTKRLQISFWAASTFAPAAPLLASAAAVMTIAVGVAEMAGSVQPTDGDHE